MPSNDSNYSDYSRVFIFILISIQVLFLFISLSNDFDYIPMVIFFLLGGLIFSLKNPSTAEENNASKERIMIKSFSLFIMVFGIIIITINSFETATIVSNQSHSKITPSIIVDIKTVEGGFLAITALIVSIVSSIYIWSLQAAKSSADSMINDLREQKLESAKYIDELKKQKSKSSQYILQLENNCIEIKEIPNLHKKIKKIKKTKRIQDSRQENTTNEINELKISSLSFDRTKHLILLQRAIINFDKLNTASEKYITHLHNILLFEEAALGLIKSKGEITSPQIEAVSTSLRKVNTSGAYQNMPIELVEYLVSRLEGIKLEDEVARELNKHLIHELRGTLLKLEEDHSA